MKTALKSLAPNWLKRHVKARRAAAFRKASLRSTLRETAEEVCDSTLAFCAGQRSNEIVGFLELASRLEPRMIGEIGSAQGGNLLLFSLILPADGELISVDLIDDPFRPAIFQRLVSPTQQLACLRGDSHDPATKDQVKAVLTGRQFDVLFVDGDHSYEGVAADFEMYAPLVRAGGIVGFHDIVPDAFQRFGRPTPSQTGGVPIFWQELKTRFAEHWEFVDDPDQDGFGIGAIRWPGVN